MKASAMNIFITSPCAMISAQSLDDLRLNKMILETAQLLSGAARLLFGLTEKDIPELYKLTHKNHPCSIWARKNKHNFIWLLNHFHYLAQEKLFRSGVQHLSYTKLYTPLMAYVVNNYTVDEVETYCRNNPVFDFNCTDFKAMPVHDAYRKQMLKKWHDDAFVAHRKPMWRKRGCPDWAVLTPKAELEQAHA